MGITLKYCMDFIMLHTCIPYRYKGIIGKSLGDEEEIEVLVITSQRKGKGMLFPKGGWETDESIESAALRETVEEAGVVGDVECSLGKWNIKNKSNDCSECHMFPLLVKEQLEFWPEKDSRERLWISVREARKVCQYWWMTEALEILVNRLRESGSGGVKSKSNL
ncbi:nudix hydrolase 18, mitochondrial-like [Dorcoceras hygrometricum]|uniref:Nudix hydrolase 18, mitochondrial-like n=1 Tax=Dorcoceras hygrometricum TaxID=472368 RepID=A0A2Z7CYE3_9LAMI|nr:nudix hydrolase 18, mitochondrial-like [Dorcoceras hygrometricum]